MKIDLSHILALAAERQLWPASRSSGSGCLWLRRSSAGVSYRVHRHHGDEQHPIGKILPPMPVQERRSLRNDLVVNGLQLPITRYEEKVLDDSREDFRGDPGRS